MSVPKASTVANKFVKEYYTKLQNSPETMKLFYNEKVSPAALSSMAQSCWLARCTRTLVRSSRERDGD